MRLPVFLMAILLAATSWGCGGGGQAAKKPSPPLKIAVSLADMESDGNKIIKKVMESRKKKDSVDITWLDAKNDPSEQEKQLEKIADQKVKAVVFQPVNPVTGPNLMRRLVEKNIKVVALERLPVDAPVDAFVTSDHSLAGQLLARFAIRSARKGAGLPVQPDSSDYGAGQAGSQGGGQSGSNGQGGSKGQGGGSSQGGSQKSQSGGAGQQKTPAVPPGAQVGGKIPIGVVILGGDPEDPMSREIMSAARSALQGNPEVSLLAEESVPRGDPAQVPGILQRLLTEKGNAVQAVLATDSRLAMAAVDVLKSAGLNSRVITAGVGADEKASKALSSGDHDAEVDTRPDLLGQFALDAAMDLAKNGKWQYDGQTASGSYSVPSRVTPVRLIQSDNAYLLKQRWGGQGGSKGGGGGDSGGGSGSGSGGDSGSGSGGDSGGGSQGGSAQGGEKDKGAKGKKTMLRITTQDGKTMEVQIDGEIKKIESTGGGQGSQGGQGDQGGGQAGGQGGQGQ